MLFAWSIALAAPLCLYSKASPTLPRAVELPLSGQTGETLRVDWSLAGERRSGESVAVVNVHFADGHDLVARMTSGAQLSSSPVTRRDIEVIELEGGRWGTRQTIVLGSRSPLAKVTVSGRSVVGDLCVEGFAVVADPVQVAASPDAAGWYPFSLEARVDALPAALPIIGPAGARGFVSQNAQGHLQFADGRRARFWGTNLMTDAAFPEKAEANAYAATLARLGFNLVRLHHVDKTGRGVVDPDRGKPGHEDVFDDERLDRFDWFVSRLQAHGIHLWAEVATSREFSAADGVANPEGAPNGHKLYPMWEPDWEAAYFAWFEAFWGRANPYTKRRFADDPAVVVLELANEHSLLIQWGFGLEQLAPSHLASLEKRWNAWLLAKYPDDSSLAMAWDGSVHPGLQPGESLVAGTVAREPMYPTLADRWPFARRRDLLAFYASLEEGFYLRLSAKARAMGFRVPMLPTILYNAPTLQVLHPETNVSDLHIAYDKGGDGVIAGTSLLRQPTFAVNFLPGALAGTAVSVSELSHGWPTPWRAESPWLWTTLASVQDWDVLVWSFWDELRTNSVVVSQLPAASAAFRGEWIPSASGLYPINLSSAAVRASGGQLERPLPLELLHLPTVLLHRVRTFIDRPTVRVGGAPRVGVGWWSDPGFLVVDQPRVQAQIGFSGAPKEGGGATVASGLRITSTAFAAVALVSADDEPLATSRLAWLTAAARAQPTGASFAAFGTTLRSPGEAPTVLEPIGGTIAFRWKGRPRVVALDGAGREIGERAVTLENGWWILDAATLGSPWLKVSTR